MLLIFVGWLPEQRTRIKEKMRKIKRIKEKVRYRLKKIPQNP